MFMNAASYREKSSNKFLAITTYNVVREVSESKMPSGRLVSAFCPTCLHRSPYTHTHELHAPSSVPQPSRQSQHPLPVATLEPCDPSTIFLGQKRITRASTHPTWNGIQRVRVHEPHIFVRPPWALGNAAEDPPAAATAHSKLPLPLNRR